MILFYRFIRKLGLVVWFYFVFLICFLIFDIVLINILVLDLLFELIILYGMLYFVVKLMNVFL